MTRGAGLPNDLEHKMFFGEVGNTIQLQLQQGFLILCVTEQTKRIKSYKVGIAMKDIQPSTATQQKVYAEATDFGTKNHSSDAFEKAASQMNHRIINVGENDNSVEGIQTPKEFIRWSYDDKRKEGDISDIITAGDNKYVVAHLIQINKMGTIPLEQVKNEVKAKVIVDKKAEKIMADMKTAISGGLASVAQKTGSATATAKGLTFESPAIPSLGKENAVIGTMSAMNTGATLSQPIQGELGVYVIKVDSTYYTEKTDYRITQMKEQRAMQNRAPNDAYDALVKKAGFVSHIGKYY
jgi:peptidyl-prolyl cis-trans isomerase D